MGTEHISLNGADAVVHFAFTDRHGGVSPAPYDQLNLGGRVGDDPENVRENRRRVAVELGLDPARVVWMNQVHSPDVAVVDGPWAGEAPEVDGIVTTKRGLALAVLVADCTPVLLADPEAGVVGAAHAGRQGMVKGVVPATVRQMVELGARPERMYAMTGPAVCGACYEVPQEMQDEVVARVPAARSTTRAGTPGLDIPAGVWSQLRELGVRRGTRSSVCTLESPDHYSYRRTRVTGRLAGYVWLEP
ncbi:peptidoglycan editing factor PgeF [Carbonactinospora thermoautotrophica]|uniref:Purine nucleoside phosphorylase n=1 Tax=Carbonactinospora thermoautotrophica TaxID=1469144 RepID=A0A132NIE6_9ACTN|nr:peptidoglycan editing factor PgeF [Carbonactinospora thermoautotrophica]KWX00328.1 laccase [Carbonactinospora thermoautotrophica]KWX01580.1 Multi-copper polyphenol oxidoreductase [Carbonactinospora thermoautotrophica]KWX09482.1 laccase [Carbonactinospora thermoautotrophica]MCX9190754.1 peptidoglycan editing factor PgeF [Carbonactinospora thermoautotrophica]